MSRPSGCLGICLTALLSLLLAHAVQGAETPKPCFTIVVDSTMQDKDGSRGEQHHFEARFRPATVGDSADNSASFYTGPEDCAIAALRAGDTRRFFLQELHGVYRGVQGTLSATARIDQIDRYRGMNVVVKRKEQGATLEFSANSPLPSDRDEDLIGVCAAQHFEPRPQVFNLTEDDLKQFATLRKSIQLTMPLGENDCVGKATAVLSAILEPVDDELVFEPSSSYDSWIPAAKAEDMPGVRMMEPAVPLQIIVRIQPKKPGGKARQGRIYFVLDEVSQRRGQCGNYPRGASLKDDLRFPGKQPAGIEGNDKFARHTSDKVSEAAVIIEATDMGAYGKLRASAPDLQLEAIYKPTNAPFLTIPRDDDRNHVADAWDQQMNTHGTQDSDEDSAAGQDRTGDSLTYFDEYRGLVVVENGEKVFHRFDPKLKELLVINPDGIFDSALWEQASGIVPHLLDDSLIAGGGDPEASRVVNFNSDSGHPKYAVRVFKVAGIDDKEDPQEKNKLENLGKTACGQCRSPKDADSCKVFPDRITAKIDDLYQWLGLALAQPTSPQGQELAGAGFPPWLAQRALDSLRVPAIREALVRQFITQIAIHEVGHACGLDDHQTGSPPGLRGAPVRACPMYIPADKTYHRYILLQVLFRPDAALPMQYLRFCRGVGLPGFDCFRKLNVKDW